MKKMIAIFLIIAVLLGLGVSVSALTVPAEGLVSNSAYWKNLNFDEANDLMWQATYGKPDGDFILVHYSRNCYYCQQVVPQIKSLADQNGIFVYGIDAFNELESEDSYFYDYGNYLGSGSRGYAIAYMYNSRTNMVTAKHTIHDIMTFMQMLVTAGVKPIRKEPLTRTTYSKLADGYSFNIFSLKVLKNETLGVAVYDKNDRLLDVIFPEITTEKSYTVRTYATNADYAKVFIWNSIGGMSPAFTQETVEILK